MALRLRAGLPPNEPALLRWARANDDRFLVHRLAPRTCGKMSNSSYMLPRGNPANQEAIAGRDPEVTAGCGGGWLNVSSEWVRG
jgi:hypothetical protein